MKCSQCGLPAIGVLGGSPLCVDHFATMERLLQQRAELAMKRRDSIRRQMWEIAGLDPPASLQPQPVVHAGPTTFNQVVVRDSVVGAINQGKVEQLNVKLKTATSTSNEHVAEVIALLAQAVVDSPDLKAEAKDEVLEHLDQLADMNNQPSEKRNRSVGKIIVRRLHELLQSAGATASVWQLARQILEALFS